MSLDIKRCKSIDVLQELLDQHGITKFKHIVGFSPKTTRQLRDAQTQIRVLNSRAGQRAILRNKETRKLVRQRSAQRKRDKKERSKFNVFGNLQTSARTNDIAFHLTKEQVGVISSCHCYYCHAPPPVSGDRIDSNGIYTIENMLPCCTQCNMAKQGHLPDVFIGLMQVIAQHLQNASVKFVGIHKKIRRQGYNAYVKSTKDVTLTESEYAFLINSECFYCGMPQCNGIDRIDSAQGHSFDNCRSCCATCNFLKKHKSENDFYAMMNHINERHPILITSRIDKCKMCPKTELLCFNTWLCRVCYFNTYVNTHRTKTRESYVPRVRTCAECNMRRPILAFTSDSETCNDCKNE